MKRLAPGSWPNHTYAPGTVPQHEREVFRGGWPSVGNDSWPNSMRLVSRTCFAHSAFVDGRQGSSVRLDSPP